MISGKKSQYIVKELSKIVGHNINFMNDEGIVIASTDQSRIGVVHEGALIVLKTKKKLEVKENEYAGTKAGINLPVYFENRIIGVIGITSTEPEVMKMAEIIRKMTEILIKEQLIDEREEIVNQSREVFIRDWLEGRWKEEKVLSSRGWMLGLNVNLPRVAVTIHIQHEDDKLHKNPSFDLQKEHNRYFGYLREAVKFNEQDLIVPLGLMKFVILLTSQGSSAEKNIEFVSHKIHYILRQLPKSEHFSIIVGVGGHYDFIRGVSASYLEAEKAASLAKPTGDVSIVFYDDLRLEILLESVPEENRQPFVRKILNLESFSDPEEITETLSLFFACNQSINKTAEQLYIHKNTLQYRLIKIKETTGYDPRVFDEAVLLYLALYFKPEHAGVPFVTKNNK
ncbi:CdaR family transcriptional regulator [Paenibacillus aestuarii]|uniref:CdaR family transcriptional regulator n=1 Tax=Paenibacillus aestuarii TaxID=516965 RepID=A0ABW0KH96_9BACL|nr:sugar diacid recognition domain-containing protein [Paenibacillus aestuarii]